MSNQIQMGFFFCNIKLIIMSPCSWNSPGNNTGVGCYSLLQGSSWPRDWTQVSYIGGIFFTVWATRQAPRSINMVLLNMMGNVWEFRSKYYQFKRIRKYNISRRRFYFAFQHWEKYQMKKRNLGVWLSATEWAKITSGMLLSPLNTDVACLLLQHF